MKHKNYKLHTKAWRERQREQGYCPNCGAERLQINPRTGKYYRLGPACLKVVAARMKVLMQRRRRAER